MSSGRPMHEKPVLVVDDDAAGREALAGLLDVMGYPVLMAENGQKAFEVLNKTSLSPCVILLDLRMPVMDGRAFLERRATDTELRRIPVVVMSGNPPSREPFPGPYTYLRKPLVIDRLIEALSQHC